MNKSIFAFLTAFVLFILLLGLALAYQSSRYLYAASAVPVLIVPFLPDIRTKQYLKLGKTRHPVKIFRTAGEGDAELLVIEFKPGAIRWNKHLLYFQAQDIPTGRENNDQFTATLPVLKFDLKKHRVRKKWIGIHLSHLKERSASYSYTVDEVSRFVVHMEDIRELTAARSSLQAPTDKSLQA